MKKVFLAVAVSVVSLSLAAAQTISVTVNGEALVGPSPVQAPDGTILVPLRGIFERLGATVQFLPATRTIAAVRGNTSITLPLGEMVGYVNGKAKNLTVPAQNINGVTVVPLRFVSEAFGAKVKWDPAAHLVAIDLAGAKPVASTGVGQKPAVVPVKGLRPEEIKPAQPQPQPQPPLPDVAPVLLPSKTDPIEGTITGLAVADGKLTVRPAVGEQQVITLATDAIILVKVGDAPQVRQELSALQVGDFLKIRRDAQGKALLIEASYSERSGLVKNIELLASGSYVISFTEGPGSEVSPTAVVTRLGAAAKLSEIKSGDKVRLRINPSVLRAVAVAIEQVEPPPPAKAEIAKVTHSAGTKWVKAGDTITFTVTGTSGGKGSVRVPGLAGAESLPLVETTPGSYTAAVTIPAGITLKDATVLASLTVDTIVSPTVAANETFSVDAVGPVLGTFTPADGMEIADLRPNFTGTYADTGSGIDVRKTQLMINGEDVSARAVLTDAFFTFQPAADLAPGRVTARLIARDLAGNETSREWGFTVLPVVLLKSVTALPNDKPLDFGDILSLKVEGVPGAKVVYAIGPKVKNQPLIEDSPGVYVGSYAVKREDAVVNAPIVVTLTDRSGRTATMNAEKTVTFTAGTPEAPVIDLPQEGASVGNSVVISGRTLPNATVKVAVRYTGKRAGILSASGPVAEVTVKADVRGRWSTEPITLKAPKELTGLIFSAEALAAGTSGTASTPAIVKFKR